jgi:hypothetical protein
VGYHAVERCEVDEECCSRFRCNATRLLACLLTVLKPIVRGAFAFDAEIIVGIVQRVEILLRGPLCFLRCVAFRQSSR